MIAQTLVPELKQEAAQTRKMLEKIPFDQWQWKPHEKSMSLGSLATHVAELSGWTGMIVNTKELDFSKGYHPAELKSTDAMLQLFDQNSAQSVIALDTASDESLTEPWTLRNGDVVYFSMPRVSVIRTFAMNHMIHHRAQISVYLRLLNIPVPGMYGPSADESK
jgi:uncharacterized damage-inducible protein DinB